MLGDQIEVSKDMDTYVRKLPLGVVAAVCPFNFPGQSYPPPSLAFSATPKRD